MKKNALIIGIVISLIITFVSVGILSAKTVEVKSKGRAWAETDGSIIKYGCDNSDEVVCTITITTPS